MLSEKNIEFELSGPGPPGRTYTSITGYFYEKKNSKNNLRLEYYLVLKYCTRQCAFNFLYLGPINYKI